MPKVLEIDVPGVEASVKGMVADIDRLSKQSRFVWTNEILMEAGAVLKEEIQGAIQETTKIGTGNMYNSVTVEKVSDGVSVEVKAFYSRWVNDGTKPSPGRFVPAIGKRLVNGRRRKSREVELTPKRSIAQLREDLIALDTPAPIKAPVKKTATHKTTGQRRTEAINRRARGARPKPKKQIKGYGAKISREDLERSMRDKRRPDL